jgi:hypothetical protein
MQIVFFRQEAKGKEGRKQPSALNFNPLYFLCAAFFLRVSLW